MTKLFLLASLLLILCAQAMNARFAARASAAPLTCFNFSPVPVRSPKVVYRTYSNARYQYSIAYPSGLLEPQGEADNGDGQKFSSKNGRSQLLVYGTHNLDNAPVNTSYEKAVREMSEDGRVITYKAMKKGWFVISGRQGSNIFYSKTIHRGETLVTFIIEYPAAERATYDPITARIARSFSA